MPRRKEMPERCREAHGATFKNWRLLKSQKCADASIVARFIPRRKSWTGATNWTDGGRLYARIAESVP